MVALLPHYTVARPGDCNSGNDATLYPIQSFFIKLAFDEDFDFGQGLLRIMTVGVNGDFAPGPGGQHHKAHNALPVDPLAVLFHEDVAAKAIGGFDKHGGRPGVDAQLIRDMKIFCHYGTAFRHCFCAHLSSEYTYPKTPASATEF